MSATPETSGRASVLLLSGRPAFLDPLSQALCTAGLVVIVARDLATAAAGFVTDQAAPNVVPVGAIVDLINLEDDPNAVCDALRASPAAASIPILFIGTGQEGVRSTTDALIAGGDGFFQLPVEAARVTAKIAAYVGAPTPDLPQGLLVTIDETDLLERTPEPARVVVPPAALPEDLLGDDDELDSAVQQALAPDPKTDSGDAVVDNDEKVRSAVEEAVTSGVFDPFSQGATPPGGTARRLLASDPGDASAHAAGEHSSPPGDDRETFSDDFGDHTAPMIRRPPPEPRAPPPPAIDDELEVAATAVTDINALAARAAAAAAPYPANATVDRPGNEAPDAADALEDAGASPAVEEAEARLRDEEARLAALRAAREERIAARLAAEAHQAARLSAVETAVAATRQAIESETAALAALDDEARAAEVNAEASLAALADLRDAAETELQALKADGDSARLEHQARLAKVTQDRAEAEAAIEGLRAEHAERAREAEHVLAELAAEREIAQRDLDALVSERDAVAGAAKDRLATLARERTEAEHALAELADERRRRIELEEARLRELAGERAATEGALASLHADQEARRKDEEARLEEVTNERVRAERQLAALQLEAQERSRDAERELDALERRLRDTVREHEATEAEIATRRAEQSAELELLSERRATLEADIEAADEARAQRLAEEQAELEILSERRALAEANDEEVRRAREAAQEQEESRLAALRARRDELERDLRAATEEAQAHTAHEAARLAALADARTQAEERLRATEAEHRARLEDERARLAAITAERDERAVEVAELERVEAERHASAARELQALAAERDALSGAVRELEAQRERAAEQQRADGEALAVARARIEDELRTLLEDRAVRESSARAALAALQAEHDAAAQTFAEREGALARAVDAEQQRLAALEAERLAQEARAREDDASRRARIAAQEEHLKRLAEQAAAERARLADDAIAAARALEDAEARGQARLAELAAEEQATRTAAAREAERLARLRAEEEAARAALEDARARARLSFVAGRFDSLPPGVAVGGVDVGSVARSADDALGLPLDGPLRAIGEPEREPPPPPPFRSLEPPEGRFVEGDLPSLLLAAWSQRVTGAIDIVAADSGAVGGRLRTLFLEEGEPIAVASALPSDRPEEQLLRGGFITAALHAELRAAEPRSARRLCAQLVDDGHLKLEELFSAVRGVLTEQVLRLCEWQTGTFSFREERPHAADRVRLEHSLDAVVAEGVRRKYDEPRLWGVLGGPQTLLGPGDTTRPLPPLSAEERLALERCDGTRSLDDVVFSAGLHGHVVLRAAVIGVCSGALRVLARGLPRSDDDGAHAAQRRERSVAIDRARVNDKLALARHGDYFSFLGVEASATPFEVHRAAARLRERFDPSRYVDAAFADLRAALVEIVDTARDAEAVLADPQLKDAYRANLRAAAARDLPQRAFRALTR